MEDDLDAISRGESEHVEYLRQFYFGNGQGGLKPHLESKTDEINARDVSRVTIGQPEGQEPIFVRVGRYGPFLEQGVATGERFPTGLAPDELTLAVAWSCSISLSRPKSRLGLAPRRPADLSENRPLRTLCAARRGRRRRKATKCFAAQRDAAGGYRSRDGGEAACRLPRKLGQHPTNGQPVLAYNGRFGPYVKCGDETRSLPADVSPST